MIKSKIDLPHGVGSFSNKWIAMVVLLLALMIFGGYAYSQQYSQGEIVTGLRNIGPMGGATWGLYVAMYIYLMGLSFAGITFAALVRMLKVESLKPLVRMAEALTVFSIISGAILTIVDIGQPIRGLVNLWKYARPQSPFFGTFTLVIAGYLFASIVYLYLEGRPDAALLAKKGGALSKFHKFWAAGYQDTPPEKERREKSSFWLAVAIIPLLITATSTLGFVFGLQSGRPGWFGALQAPGFVILASLSGAGMLVMIAAGLRKSMHLEEYLDDDSFKTLSNIMMVLTIIYIYFTVVEWLSSFYSAHPGEIRITQALISGEYSTIFWITITLFLVPMFLLIGQFVLRNYSRSIIVLSAIMLNLAAIGKRYLIVVPSQTHGTLLPYGTGFYSPTWVEYGVVVGLLAFGILLYSLFVKVFPIMEINSAEGGA